MGIYPICLSVIWFISATSAVNECLYLGPTYPAPVGLNNYPLWTSAMKNLSSTLDEQIKTGQTPYGQLHPDGESFSINVISLDSEAPVFEYYHTANQINTTKGTSKVDADTVFRIGSITKAFTVYGLLLQGGIDILNEPVTKYIPELAEAAQNPKNAVDQAQWSEITIGALASQLSGLVRDTYLTDFALPGQLPVPPAMLGLPVLSDDEIPKCTNSTPMDIHCTRKEFLSGIIERPPVLPTYGTTPAYSNIAFGILGLVLESITGEKYSDAISRLFLNPLGMNRTSVLEAINDSWGIIPENDNSWEYNIGDMEAPAGNIYTSTADLAKFSRAILGGKQLTLSQVRQWMKPKSHTSNVFSSVGAPWEIYRYQSPDSIYHMVDIYAKGGSLNAYQSFLAFLPDYDVAIILLTAGSSTGDLSVIRKTIFNSLLPIFNQVAKEQAKAKLGGTYRSTDPGLNSSITITTDDGPGLTIETWVSNGTDMYTAVDLFASLSGGEARKPLRMYPDGLHTKTQNSQSSGTNGTVVERIGYRLVFEADMESTGSDGVSQMFDGCDYWLTIDEYVWGQRGIDGVVFDLDATREGVQIELPAFRTTLVKV